MKLHPEAPDEVTADQYLYAAWRFSTLTADEAAALKKQNLSIAAMLASFRDEWRALHGGAEPPGSAIGE